MLFNSLVLPHFDYANVDWETACGSQMKYVYKLQKRAARILTGANRFSQINPLFMKTKLDISDRKDSIPHSYTYL